MAFYSYMFHANYGRFFKKLSAVAKKEHRFFPALVVDTAWCVFRYGMALSDYLNYELYKRTAHERREYVSTRTENSFYETVSRRPSKSGLPSNRIFSGSSRHTPAGTASSPARIPLNSSAGFWMKIPSLWQSPTTDWAVRACRSCLPPKFPTGRLIMTTA